MHAESCRRGSVLCRVVWSVAHIPIGTQAPALITRLARMLIVLSHSLRAGATWERSYCKDGAYFNTLVKACIDRMTTFRYERIAALLRTEPPPAWLSPMPLHAMFVSVDLLDAAGAGADAGAEAMAWERGAGPSGGGGGGGDSDGWDEIDVERGFGSELHASGEEIW